MSQLALFESPRPMTTKVSTGALLERCRALSIAVDEITDPGLLALSGHQLSQLGLVVCDG